MCSYDFKLYHLLCNLAQHQILSQIYFWDDDVTLFNCISSSIKLVVTSVHCRMRRRRVAAASRWQNSAAVWISMISAYGCVPASVSSSSTRFGSRIIFGRWDLTCWRIMRLRRKVADRTGGGAVFQGRCCSNFLHVGISLALIKLK